MRKISVFNVKYVSAVGTFVLQCFAENVDKQWIGHCTNLCLAVQDDSLITVEKKLNDQVQDYMEDFEDHLVCLADLLGKNEIFKKDKISLKRKSPLSIRMKYHWYRIRRILGYPISISLYWLGDIFSKIFESKLFYGREKYKDSELEDLPYYFKIADLIWKVYQGCMIASCYIEGINDTDYVWEKVDNTKLKESLT